MSNPPIIAIPEVEVGTTVRVVLAAPGKQRLHHVLSLKRVEEDGVHTIMDPMQWHHIGGRGRSRFIGRVVANDQESQVMTLVIEDSSTTRRDKIRYEIEVPYGSFLRMARLVTQSREFDSVEEETAFRLQYRNSPVNKAFFDPKDRFVGVELLAIASVTDMIINFTYTVPEDGSSFTVPITNIFGSGDYTVVWSYNTSEDTTVLFTVPDEFRTTEDFQIVCVGEDALSEGTTIDFVLKKRA